MGNTIRPEGNRWDRIVVAALAVLIATLLLLKGCITGTSMQPDSSPRYPGC